jgi:hypothetical protein
VDSFVDQHKTVSDPHGTRDELMADWELAAAGEEPFRIAPLQ